MSENMTGALVVYVCGAGLAACWFFNRFSDDHLDFAEAFASTVFWPVCVLACLLKGAFRRVARGFK